MLYYEESLKILRETDALLEGHFILSSGLHSKQYVQCAKLLSYPNKAKLICESLSKKIKNKFNQIDIILSPAIGGIVIGYEIGRQLSIETIFAERVEGHLILRRGFKILRNAKVLIVENGITTGKSALECAKLVNDNEAEVLGYACLINRSNNDNKIKNNIISQIKIDIQTYTNESLPDELKKLKPIKPGSRNLFK